MRSFLDIRYTFPGYTFLIFSFGLAFPYLNQWLPNLNDSTLTIMVGIFSVLGGAPIGFYVSQVWYLLLTWDFFGLGVYGGKKRKYIQILHKLNVIEDRYVSVEVLDYLFNYYGKERIKKYVKRRWDMYNIMGSTIFAIQIGIIFGALLRNHIESYCKIGIALHEIVVIFVGVILIILFISGMYISRKEHEYMLEIIIFDVTNSKPGWRDKFPKNFFQNEPIRTN